jgi:hypothetical protein
VNGGTRVGGSRKTTTEILSVVQNGDIKGDDEKVSESEPQGARSKREGMESGVEK